VYVAGRISGILAGIIGDDEPGKQLCRTLENDNNNQMIITAVTTKKKYEKFKRIVEKHYPGLCLFDI
jgi:bifunctional ADP-heptose synthase (sugar kinase/adenylyltransferase)